MKAIIFAAGRGSRMQSLTKKICKPMLSLHGKPILEHVLNLLPKDIFEVAIVVGYRQELIKKYFKNKYRHLNIKYILQSEPKGTWQAICRAKNYLKDQEKFLALNADDLHSRQSIHDLCRQKNAILVSQHPNPERFGVVEFDNEYLLKKIEEKPQKPKGNFVSVGVYVFSQAIFECSDPKPKKGEYFLADVLKEYLKKEKVKVLLSKRWIPIGNPEELLRAHSLV
jgi:NDP-sugar pyrophosphorylase family protein